MSMEGKKKYFIARLLFRKKERENDRKKSTKGENFYYFRMRTAECNTRTRNVSGRVNNIARLIFGRFETLIGVFILDIRRGTRAPVAAKRI